ncbi:LysR family transcriptional regulator substrate-binding protein [Streptomyces lavendulocolor]|uniref:LysR family transcriptional regulator substrate-binding protein n=1 Tax=Streptomyces lavendulocolor TaxID=67316 RepID=UPI003C2C80C6
MARDERGAREAEHRFGDLGDLADTDIDVRIETVPDDAPVPALLADLVDVALVTKPDLQMDRVSLTRLFEDEMVAVVPAGHPWARRAHLTARDFDGADLVLYDFYDQKRIPSMPLPIPAGARPARITTMPVVTDLVVEMVAGGQGVTVLPNWVAAPHTTSHGLALVRIGARPLTRTWFCATRTPGPDRNRRTWRRSWRNSRPGSGPPRTTGPDGPGS